MSASAQRAALLAEVAAGAAASATGATSAALDASAKLVLGRGCDPEMAERSKTFLPPLLNNARVDTFSCDSEFFARLELIRAGKAQRPDVVFFAPGACRWSEARQPIPGGIAGVSHGWDLQQYHGRVREMLGQDILIVGTTREAEVVPLLRKALKLQ
jgi:hypothetical protein